VRSFIVLAFAALLAACAGGPPAPEWQGSAAGALEAFQRRYFSGDAQLAELEFRRARSELARTGRGDLLARAELFRCAVRMASLELEPCTGFEAVRDLAGPEELAYADYLAGGSPRAARSDEALSRLVFAAVQLKSGRVTPEEIARAVDIASAQGWRRPLLAWLGVQEKLAREAGDSETAARVRRRIELISG
jgi:hypothetical protein